MVLINLFLLFNVLERVFLSFDHFPYSIEITKWESLTLKAILNALPETHVSTYVVFNTLDPNSTFV